MDFFFTNQEPIKPYVLKCWPDLICYFTTLQAFQVFKRGKL